MTQVKSYNTKLIVTLVQEFHPRPIIFYQILNPKNQGI